MGMEAGKEEIFDVFFRRHLGEGFGKGDDDEVIDPLPGEELDLFFEGIDKPDFFGAAFDHFPGMGEEGDDNRLATDAGGFLPELGEDPGVPGVDTVKGTDSYY